MGWSSLSFPFGSLLTAAKMTQVYSNFPSMMAQEIGSPPPSGVWSFAAASAIDAPGSHHLGSVRADSLVAAPLIAVLSQAPTGVGSVPPLNQLRSTLVPKVLLSFVSSANGVFAVRKSYNVSSLGRNGPGDYTVYMATSLADGDYIPLVFGRGMAAQGFLATENQDFPTRTGGQFRFYTYSLQFTPADPARCNVLIYGD